MVIVDEAFMSHVIPEPNTGCWLWMGSLNNKGYGKFNRRGKTGYAHRAALLTKGAPPFAGAYALHQCDMPACVNPDHLKWGTQLDNMAECVRRGRQARGERLASMRRGDLHWRRRRKAHA
jgi:hypothetical protein